MMDLVFLPDINDKNAALSRRQRGSLRVEENIHRDGENMEWNARIGQQTSGSLLDGGGEGSPGGDRRSRGTDPSRKLGIAADGRRNDGASAPAGASQSAGA